MKGTVDLVNQFNVYAAQNQNMIAKALSSAVDSGGALIPEHLEKVVTDTVIRLSPELAMLITKKIAGNVHEFDRLIQRPARGGAMGEKATTPASSSKVERATVSLKIVRRKGEVTNFLLDTSEEFIDAAAFEVENHIHAHVLDLIYYLYYGNVDANTYEFDGWNQFIEKRVAYSAAKGGAVPANLKFLDNMIDWSNRKGGDKHKRFFAMSPEMLSLVSSLLTNVRLNQGLAAGGLTQVDVGGGWRLNAYRDIPIIETTSLTPVSQMDDSTITLTGVTSGGSLADGTYYVRIAPLTYEGEQVASDEKSVAVSGGGGSGSITVDFSAVHQVDSVDAALGYIIYIGTVSGTYVPIMHVPAFTYDSNGTPNGDNGVDTSITITTTTPNSSIPTHLQSDIPLDYSSGIPAESIVLIDVDPIQGLGKMPYTNKGGDRFEGLVTMKPLAETDDFINFLVKSYPALADSFQATSYWLRNVRAS